MISAAPYIYKEEAVISRPIHYLGSKLRILEQIQEILDEVDPSMGAVCDLFAGSGTVSKFLAVSRPVISADIQEYSKVICEALLLPRETQINVEKFMKLCRESSHTKSLIFVFKNLLDYEKQCIYNASNLKVDGLYEIVDNGSIITYEIEGNNEISVILKKNITQSIKGLEKLDWVKNPQAMLTRYYGGLYFSYYQAVCMDAILEQAFLLEGREKNVCLAALLSTASEIVNTVGKQFAQPLKVKDSNGKYKLSLCKKMVEDRNLDTFSIFEKWLNNYLDIEKSPFKNKIIKMNYVEVLESLKGKNIKAIYADPPYTRYHYSRYYHVLESICLRDNPKVTTTFPNGNGGISRGIYREDRYQSVFCIKSKAEPAFENLFQKTKELNIPLILSYSPFEPSQAVTPRLQTIDQLVLKAKEYFSDVNVISPGAFTHSKLNCVEKNFDSNHEAELLIICR